MLVATPTMAGWKINVMLQVMNDDDYTVNVILSERSDCGSLVFVLASLHYTRWDI